MRLNNMFGIHVRISNLNLCHEVGLQLYQKLNMPIQLEIEIKLFIP